MAGKANLSGSSNQMARVLPITLSHEEYGLQGKHAENRAVTRLRQKSSEGKKPKAPSRQNGPE